MRQLIDRKSCRNFKDKQIPENILQKLFEVGVNAPTGGNLQPFSIIKIAKQETKDKLAKLSEQGFMSKAPIHLLFCIDWHRIKRWAELDNAPFAADSSFRHFWISFQDTNISAQNICTAADSYDLGSVYIGTVLEFFPQLKKMFDLPNGVFPVVLLCLGYPKTEGVKREKLPAELIIHNEKYTEVADDKLLNAYKNTHKKLKVDITNERLKTIHKVCKNIHGDDFANKCIASIKDAGFINPIQYIFGLHYEADEMAKGNEDYLKLMNEFGFNWFNK